MTGCGVPGPQGGVVCGRSVHSAAIAHHAGGLSEDGTAWSVFWWDARSANAVERPPTKLGIPFPRMAD